MKTEIEYYRPDYGEKESDAKTFKASWDDLSLAVQELCEKNFSRWDYSIPDPIMARRSGSDEWQSFSVEVETVPHFHVSKS